MKKVYQSFISILLVFSLLASMTLTSFATAKNNKVGDKVTLYEDHETIVEMYTDLSGNRILNQYLNGKLIQRDTLLTSSPNSIKRDFFDDSVTRKSSSDVIYYTHCYHQTMSYYNSGASTPFRTDTDYYQAVGG